MIRRALGSLLTHCCEPTKLDQSAGGDHIGGIQAPSSSGPSVAFEAGVTQWYRTPALGDTATATLLAKVSCDAQLLSKG
jgi:hypothetical protein